MVLKTLIGGKDVFTLLPTGFGKSVIQDNRSGLSNHMQGCFTRTRLHKYISYREVPDSCVKQTANYRIWRESDWQESNGGIYRWMDGRRVYMHCGRICSRKTALALSISIPTLFFVYFAIPYCIRFLEDWIPMGNDELGHADMKLDVLNFTSRTDVQTSTSWGAPIIWDGMFIPEAYEQIHRTAHTSVALTVFAVGKYLDVYLKDLLVSSQIYFMVGIPVTYYVFTDVPEKVPAIYLAPGREVKVMPVKHHSRWQDISMMRMMFIRDAIDSQIQHHHQYVFCMDVDQVFRGHFGTEVLADSVALLHAHYYFRSRKEFTYDRNPKSLAYMADTQGDFYYHASVFGGSWQSVRKITDTCYRTIMGDKENGVEALWQDESHLNKYFWEHKPSKVLSPEYCWDTSIRGRTDIHIQRLIWQEKHYKELRNKEN